MKIIESKVIPFKGYLAINLFGIVFTRNLSEFVSNPANIRHEYTHTLQWRELWYVGFIFIYLYYWLHNMICKGMSAKQAYKYIPLEREAYLTENTDWYNKHREKFAWKKYTKMIY